MVSILASQVSAAVVNYQTPDLIETAVRSFHHIYPNVRVLVIDNGSRDESPDVLRSLSEELASVTPLFLERNRHHGPALHMAVEKLETPFVYIFDSDTKTHRGGFLEQMIDRCADDDVYGAGRVVHVNRSGFSVENGIPVLVSAFMVLKRTVYLDLPPFMHHGLPVLKNYTAAVRKGYRLAPFPIEEYVEHIGRGTVERYGYGLGFRSRIDYILHRLGF